jgi:hypothetical protein
VFVRIAFVREDLGREDKRRRGRLWFTQIGEKAHFHLQGDIIMHMKWNTYE